MSMHESDATVEGFPFREGKLYNTPRKAPKGEAQPLYRRFVRTPVLCVLGRDPWSGSSMSPLVIVGAQWGERPRKLVDVLGAEAIGWSLRGRK